ncbi:hypothetical protein ACOSP7_019021 [Xanthoceras sorbifolium]
MVADRDDGNIKAKRSILLLCGYYMEDYEVMVLFQALLAYKVSIDAFCPEKRAGDVCQTSVHECSAHQVSLCLFYYFKYISICLFSLLFCEICARRK